MKKFIASISIIILIVIAGYIIFEKQLQKTPNTNTVQVAASFYPLYYFASEVGGEKAHVFSITPNGVEPHDYEPNPQDIITIQQSQLLLLNGAGFEPWSEKLRPELEQNKVTIISTSEGLSLQKGEAHEEAAHADDAGAAHEEETVLDPHIWLSPIFAKEQVDKITKGFISVDAANKATYETNAQKLKSKLDTLDQSYKKGLANCTTRSFVTSHTAFGYLANEYNLEQIAIAGLSPDQEPSPAQLATVSNFVRTNNIKYIFFETLISPDFSQTLAQETGARTLVLDPIEGIPDDEIKQGRNYFTVMENNLKNLQTALECK